MSRFKERGKTGIFNKELIRQQLNIPYISVRKAIDKLQANEIIRLEYDIYQKIYRYTFDGQKLVNVVIEQMQKQWPDFGLTGSLAAHRPRVYERSLCSRWLGSNSLREHLL